MESSIEEVAQKLHGTVFRVTWRNEAFGSSKSPPPNKGRLFRPHTRKDIEHYVTSVCSCLKQRSRSSAHLHLHMSTDFFQVQKSNGGYGYILVIVDHLTMIAQAWETKNKSAWTAGRMLNNDLIPCFGLHARFLHDRGGGFENLLLHQLEECCGILLSQTIPYHPQENGKTETVWPKSYQFSS